MTATLNGVPFTATVPYAFGAPTNYAGEEAGDRERHHRERDRGRRGDDNTWTYTKEFVCPAETQAYNGGVYVADDFVNTAQILETKQSDSATVKLTCYAPVVEKSADAKWNQGIDWTLDKSVTPASAEKFAGESATFDYTVTVTKSVTNTYVVSGIISVTNPAPEGSMEVSLADQLSDGTIADIDCGDGTSTVVVPAGTTVSCSYTGEASAPDVEATNMVTATFNWIDFFADACYGFSQAARFVRR